MSDSAPEKRPEASTRVIPKFTSFKAPLPSRAAKELAEAPKDESDKLSKGKERESHRNHRRSHHRSRSRSHERKHRSKHRERDQKEEERPKRRHRDSSRDRSHRHRSGHEREKDEARRRHRNSRSRSPKKASLVPRNTVPRSPSPETWDAPQKQYFVDTRGDENNLVYGTIHRYSIPDYRRGGAGRVVGLPMNLKIDREKDDGKALVLRSGGPGKEGSSMRSMQQAFAKLDSKDVRRLRVKKDETSLEEAFSRGFDFVPLSDKTKKRKTRGEEVSDNSDNDRDHYRSIEGLKKSSSAPDDQDLEYASESQSDGDYVAAEEWGDRKRMVEFVRKIDTEPTNVDAWLAYVNHHDTAISGVGRRKTAAEKRSTAEVKLDILQKGLEKNPGNEALLLKFMDVAQEIWDSQKLLSKWKRILEENPAIVSLWTKYINFRQTDFLSFTYPECLKCFSECLAVLRAAAFKADTGSPQRGALDGVILYVFTRTILLMDQSGYREKAVAALQAMMELNLFRPLGITPSSSQREFDAILDQLETFWDSEVPRIGEEKAQGWASFVGNGEDGDSPDAVEDNLQLPPLDSDDPFGSWAEAEVEWSRRTGMPARTIDEIEEDDPYRVILFSDIKGFMFCFSSDGARKILAGVFLLLKGIPLLDLLNSNSDAVADVFLHNGPAILGFDSVGIWFWPKKQSKWDTPAITWEGMEPEKKAAMGDIPFEYKLRNFPIGCESVFSKSSSWFDVIETLRLARSEDVQFVRNTLKMLVEKLGDESWALYYLAWEWGNASNGIKKVAKSLLKRFKTSIRLWSAYSQIEWHDSGVDAGRKVFTMALGMSKEFSESARRDSILLWHAWIWEELFSGNTRGALRLVLSIDGGQPLGGVDGLPREISKALLLKSRRYLEDQQQTMLSLHYDEHAGAFNDLRALLEYLAGSENIDAAIMVYDTFISELDRRSMTGPTSQTHELCLLRKSRLVYLHSITAKPFKPATLRSHLEAALENFPQNSAFLSLYAWNESRTKIENRVRTIIRDKVLKGGGETVISWLFAVWVEMRMSQHYNVHAVRSLFERAVECDRTRFSVQLWMAFVEFELQHKEYRRAKEMLFRAIRHCLIMMAFTKLRSALELEELRKLLSIMSSEKELRVHDVTELEDMVEEMDRQGGKGSPGLIALPHDDTTDEEMEDG